MKIKVKSGIDLFVVAPGVWGLKDVFVNMYVINNPPDNNWWLVDTGLAWSGSKIKKVGELLFGAGSKPAAIILTHGHFDHVGSVKKLVREWDIPVYAHHLEIPYLTGISSYPPADPTVGGGLMADISFLYPRGPINIEEKVVSLPQGGRIPGLPQWQYLHTPGHAPGHISLFRQSDKVLIAGDAITTTKAESLFYTLTQLKKLSGPPKYLTSDWASAAASVEKLATLEPEIIATGHGNPMRGASMRKSLHNLARDFEKVAIPATGRYNSQPALMDDSGVVHIPPKNRNATAAPTLKFLGITAGILLTILLFKKSKAKQKKKKKKKKKKEQLALMDRNRSTGKYMPRPKPKKFQAPIREEISKIKNLVTEKSAHIKDQVVKDTNTITKPAFEMLDRLKFKVRKRLK